MPYIDCHPDQNTSQESLPVILLILPVFHNTEVHGNNWIVVPKIVTSFSWQNFCLVFDGVFKILFNELGVLWGRGSCSVKGSYGPLMFGKQPLCRTITRRWERVYYPLTAISLGLPLLFCWFLYLLLLPSFSFVGFLWSGSLTGSLYGGHCCN